MQGSRFDALTRWTARRITRRSAVAQAGAGLAAAFGLTTLGTHAVTAQVATPVPEASPAPVPVSLLFVQHAGPTTLTPGTGDIHTLTMTRVPAQTLYFSDRPNRIAGAKQTAAFVDGFAEAFADSPPNATLIGHFESGVAEEEAVVLTLLSAAYDEETATLTYEVTLIDVELITDVAFEREPLTVLNAPREYAEANLFIDDWFTDFFEDFYLMQCSRVGASPCGTQSTNCCDDTCASVGRVSMYATETTCTSTSDPTLVEAHWDCKCSASPNNAPVP